MGGRSLSHWTTREVPQWALNEIQLGRNSTWWSGHGRCWVSEQEARDPVCGPGQARGWGVCVLGPTPSGLPFTPTGTDQGPCGMRPWLHAAWRPCLPERHCPWSSEPNKRPVTKAAAAQLEAAGPVWGAGPGLVWNLGTCVLPSLVVGAP